MAALQDASVGTIPEVAYGTALTPTRFYEFVDESFDYSKTVKQGAGIRVGSKVARSARRVVTETQAKGDLTVELTSKGLGTLLQACFGAGASTLVSGTTYQQNFTLGTGATPPSMTVQKGLVRADGTVDPYTYNGGVVDSFEIDCPQGDIAKVKSSWIFRDVVTSTTYATPSYVTTPNLFHFAQGSITIGGTVTAPTTTALASGGTSVANVRDFSVKVDNKLTADRFNYSGAGKMLSPTYGLRDISGKLTAEYTDQALLNAYMADSPLALSLTFVSSEALSSGTATLQIILPEIKLNGELPQANGTELITQSVDFDVLDNLTATQPVWVVLRTADTAL
jgi:hypothetical protein